MKGTASSRWDWLFGPAIVRSEGQIDTIDHRPVKIRSVELDIATVLEAVELLNREFEREPTIIRLERSTTDDLAWRDITAEEVLTLNLPERQRIHLHKYAGSEPMMNPQADLSLATGAPTVTVDPISLNLHAEVIMVVLANGHARPLWRPLGRKAVAALPAVVLGGIFAWTAADQELALAPSLLGVAALIFIAALCIRCAPQVHPYAEKAPGHHIREESRERTQARRDDGNRDRKLAALSGSIGVIGGLILAFATDLFGLAGQSAALAALAARLSRGSRQSRLSSSRPSATRRPSSTTTLRRKTDSLAQRSRGARHPRLNRGSPWPPSRPPRQRTLRPRRLTPTQLRPERSHPPSRKSGGCWA